MKGNPTRHLPYGGRITYIEAVDFEHLFHSTPGTILF
jgi:hypothetical protein